jgi:hypothetical protein
MKIRLFLILCFWGVTHVIQGQPTWQVTLHKMPYPVWGGQVVYDLAAQGNKIYIMGGYSDSLQQTVDWIQEYDVEKDSWKIVGHMLQPRQQFVADIWRGISVYFGGALEISQSKASLESWNFVEGITPDSFDSNIDFGRSFSTGHIVGDVLYIIGGSPNPATGKISYITSYDLVSKKVSIKYDYASEDKPRQRATFIVGDNIYVFGGAINGVIDKIQKFNIPTQKLGDLSDRLLQPRAGGAAVFNPTAKRGFVIGGYNETNPALNTVEQIFVNADGSLRINNITPLNYARTNLMAVNYKGTVAVFGGKDVKGKVVPYVEILLGLSDVNNNSLPADLKLNQNYPNPFNPNTNISYQLPIATQVSLKVFDVLGKEVATLVNEYKQPGVYQTSFSINKNGEGANLPSGIYFAQLRAENTVQTIKMILLK